MSSNRNFGDMDELLSAYLDNEMSESERQDLEVLIAQDEGLAERLQTLAEANSDFIADAALIDAMPMSETLQGVIDSLEKDHIAEAKDNNVVQFPFWKRPINFVEQHRAIAAVLVAGIAAVLVQSGEETSKFSPNGVGADGYILANSTLEKTLKKQPSGQKVGAEDATYEAKFSYVSDEGQICRVVDVVSQQSKGRLVACNETNEEWHVRVASFEPVGLPNGELEYQTASTQGAKAIEAFLDIAMTQAPLSREDEMKLLETNWNLKNERTAK